MRRIQYIGLSPGAWEWLKEKKHKKLCSYAGTGGMFEDVLHYDIYEVKDEYENQFGMVPHIRTVYEYTQEIIWSSGAMYLTALKDLGTNEIINKTLWQDSEINQLI